MAQSVVFSAVFFSLVFWICRPDKKRHFYQQPRSLWILAFEVSAYVRL